MNLNEQLLLAVRTSGTYQYLVPGSAAFVADESSRCPRELGERPAFFALEYRAGATSGRVELRVRAGVLKYGEDTDEALVSWSSPGAQSVENARAHFALGLAVAELAEQCRRIMAQAREVAGL